MKGQVYHDLLDNIIYFKLVVSNSIFVLLLAYFLKVWHNVLMAEVIYMDVVSTAMEWLLLSQAGHIHYSVRL